MCTISVFSRWSVVLAVVAVSLLPAAAQVVVEDPAASALVDPAAQVEKLAGGMKFIEGPVWIAAEKTLVFSDIPASLLMQWKDGKLSEFKPSENANGNTLDREGRLVSAQHGARNVVRREKDGTQTVLADKFDGKRLNSPNDLVVKSDGSVWFTDPPYGLKNGDEKEQAANRVYRIAPEGGAVTMVSEDFDMPNGLAFSPDEKTLYIADSGKKQRVGAFAVKDDGTLTPALYWLEGGADGIRTDEMGNLYTTTGDGVRIYSPAGKRLATIKLPEVPANCGFGGEDGKTLFMTARTGLYAIPLKVGPAKRPAKE